MDGWLDGWIDGGLCIWTYAHKLLLIIFRAHRRNTHPVVASGSSLTLLAFHTRRLMYKTHPHTHREKRNRLL